MFLSCHSNYKNITHIAHSYRARKSLENQRSTADSIVTNTRTPNRYKSERLALDLEGNDDISEETRSSLEKTMMSLEEAEDGKDDGVVGVPLIQFKIVKSHEREEKEEEVSSKEHIQVEDMPSPHGTKSSKSFADKKTRRRSCSSVLVVIRTNQSFLCFADLKPDLQTRRCTALSPDSSLVSIESTPVRDRFVLRDTTAGSTKENLNVWSVLKESSRRM